MKTYNPRSSFELSPQQLTQTLSVPNGNIWQHAQARELKNQQIQSNATQEEFNQEKLRQQGLYREAEELIKQAGAESADGSVPLDVLEQVAVKVGDPRLLMEVKARKQAESRQEILNETRQERLDIAQRKEIRAQQRESKRDADRVEKSAKTEKKLEFDRAKEALEMTIKAGMRKDPETGKTVYTDNAKYARKLKQQMLQTGEPPSDTDRDKLFNGMLGQQGNQKDPLSKYTPAQLEFMRSQGMIK